MPDLSVTIIQTTLQWEDPAANRRHFDRWIDRIRTPTDLIILPEMFTTGFSMNAAQLAEGMAGETVAWLAAKARQRQASVVGSLIVEANGGYHNRLLWAAPDGSLHTYDKRHLFRMAGEHEVYAAGRQRLTVTCQSWAVRPFICYDLRFPIWTCNGAPRYDAAVYVANWPAPRAEHWRCLLRARAIENQSYVVGVNRIGRDGNDRVYNGDSMIIDPTGKVLQDMQGKETMVTATLSRAILDDWRRTFPCWMDADKPPPDAAFA